MTDIERLKELRDAAHPAGSATNYANDNAFHIAAHAALGPDGCVTRELEHVQDLLIDAVCDRDEFRAERDALREQLTAAQRAIKDAQKEVSRGTQPDTGYGYISDAYVPPAAIEASRESGDKPAFSCPKCGEPCSSNGCPKHTTPPAPVSPWVNVAHGPIDWDKVEPDATEREHRHCVNAIPRTVSFSGEQIYEVIKFERAAVRAECQAEIEKLKAENNKLLQLVKVLGAQ
jgi:hypothetical protein